MNEIDSVGSPPRGAPAEYFPLARGRYEIRPGLSRLGTDFGNGARDGHIFQLDREFHAYRTAKLAARAEELGKYHPAGLLDVPARAAVNRLVAKRLVDEHPDAFALAQHEGERRLDCHLSGEGLRFAPDWTWLGLEGPQPAPPYRSGLDALAAQVQEDLAVVQLSPDGSDRVAALHLCFPNHWAAAEKIGRDFSATHRPVADIEPIIRHSAKLVRTMVEKGPFVRFAWGLATDTRLNHHPDPPPGAGLGVWTGRRFDPERPRLFLRIERQTTMGLPALGCALFTIRTYFTDCAGLAPERRRRLASAIASMSAQSLAYKGLADSRAAILDWLGASG